MSITDWIVVIFCIVFSFVWYGFYFESLRNLKKIPLFEHLVLPEPEAWPGLSIIITACNEADTIESAMKTVLEQDYPELEIIIVNDRSTDGTGHLVDALAKTDARVKAVHVKQLPGNWIGKVHAINAGAKVATGEWLLFTDADVHFHQGILRKAMAYALNENSDHLTLLPRVDTHLFWLETAIAAFRLMFLSSANASRLNNPNSKAFIGVGAFNMVKKSALKKSKGLEWLRMEVIDDMGLGLLMKNAGGKTSMAYAGKDLGLIWYPSLAAMFKGLEKNAFGPGTGYRYTRLGFIVVFIWLLNIVPLLAIFYTGVEYLWVLGVVAYGFLVYTMYVSAKRFNTPFVPSLFVQPGQILFTFMMINAAIKCKKQGGINWRGTIYPVEALKAGQRVKF